VECHKRAQNASMTGRTFAIAEYDPGHQRHSTFLDHAIHCLQLQHFVFEKLFSLLAAKKRIDPLLPLSACLVGLDGQGL
jgi:hypothetical protein